MHGLLVKVRTHIQITALVLELNRQVSHSIVSLLGARALLTPTLRAIIALVAPLSVAAVQVDTISALVNR